MFEWTMNSHLLFFHIWVGFIPLSCAHPFKILSINLIIHSLISNSLSLSIFLQSFFNFFGVINITTLTNGSLRHSMRFFYYYLGIVLLMLRLWIYDIVSWRYILILMSLRMIVLIVIATAVFNDLWDSC